MRCSSASGSGSGSRIARASSQADDEQVIVVAGRQHELAVAQRAPDVLEERPGRGERLVRRAVSQLEHVAEQHQAIDAVELGQQRLAQLATAQHVDPASARRDAGRR